MRNHVTEVNGVHGERCGRTNGRHQDASGAGVLRIQQAGHRRCISTDDVSWPKASEGGKIVGKEVIRAYWTRQWGEFDPHVVLLAITEEDGGKVRVRAHQLVKSLERDVLSDSEVLQYSPWRAISSQQ